METWRKRGWALLSASIVTMADDNHKDFSRSQVRKEGAALASLLRTYAQHSFKTKCLESRIFHLKTWLIESFTCSVHYSEFALKHTLLGHQLTTCTAAMITLTSISQLTRAATLSKPQNYLYFSSSCHILEYMNM